MRSLRKLNAAAGTSYTRWHQVIHALAGGNNPPGFEPENVALRGEELGAAATPQTVPGSRPGSPDPNK